MTGQEFREKNDRRQQAKRIWGRSRYNVGRRLRRGLPHGAFGHHDKAHYDLYAVGTTGRQP